MPFDELLNKHYYNIHHQSGLSSVEKLYHAAKNEDATIRKKDVKEWLKGQLTYTLHKPVRRKFVRNKIIAVFINEHWQADLVDMKLFKKENDGFSYILTVIDVFSKVARATPLKDKSGKSLVNAFEPMIKDVFPSHLQTDAGTEFMNVNFQKLLRDNLIHHFVAHNTEIKCAVAERLNRSLKSRMWKYFTMTGKKRYLEILSTLISSYNSSYHRTIKMTPNQVTPANSRQVLFNTHGVYDAKDLHERHENNTGLKPGSKVRISYQPGKFDKGFQPNWTDEVFEVRNVAATAKKPYIKLKDLENEEIKGRFYPEEVQEVHQGLYRIEKIIRKDKRRGWYVKWLNHGPQFNSWIDPDSIVSINGQSMSNRI